MICGLNFGLHAVDANVAYLLLAALTYKVPCASLDLSMVRSKQFNSCRLSLNYTSREHPNGKTAAFLRGLHAAAGVCVHLDYLPVNYCNASLSNFVSFRTLMTKTKERSSPGRVLVSGIFRSREPWFAVLHPLQVMLMTSCLIFNAC